MVCALSNYCTYGKYVAIVIFQWYVALTPWNLNACNTVNGQVSHNPPMISLSFSLSKRRPKDTRDNILNTKEFTVSIISEPFVEAADSTSVESSADHDEWIFSGLTKESSVSFDSDLLAYYTNHPPECLSAPG